MSTWLIDNWIELVGFLAGFIYVFLEINQKKLMWPVGIITALFYIVIFYQAKVYADMSLQFYYVGISIYGWYMWGRGSRSVSKRKSSDEQLTVTRISRKVSLILLLITIAIFFGIAEVLKQFTDSPVPYWDAFTTSLSITGTYMLSRKYLEQWLVWIVVNTVSVGLYFYRDLYLTLVLYSVFLIMSVIGYYKWKKEI